MKFSLTLLSLAVSALAAADVNVYTDAVGKEASVTVGASAVSQGVHAEGSVASNVEIITTIGPAGKAATTVTTTTGTHKYGRFDKTTTSSHSSSSNTHKYGRFDKTKASSHSSSSNTHRYGKFDNTPEGTATAVIKDSNGAAKVNAAGLGAVALVGALLAC